MKLYHSWFSARAAAAACVLCLFSASPQDANALTVDLVATPPDLSPSVAPNLVLTLDDSGSMANDYMPDFRPYDTGNNGWGSNAWKCAATIDATVTDVTNPRSRSMNGVYFNPNSKYELPIKADGTSTLTAPTFAAAWDNGIQQNRPTGPSASTARNLSTLSFCGQTGANVGAGYFKLKSTVAVTVDTNGNIVNPNTVLYTTANWEWVSVKNADAATKQNFANWYSYYRTRQLAAISAISRAYAPFDANIRVAWQNINSNLINNATNIYKFKDGADTNNVRTRFYDFLFATPAGGGTPNRSAVKRVGDLFARATGSADTNPYWDRDLNRELSCRQNFHIQMTDGLWNGDGGVTSPSADTDARSLPDGKAYTAADGPSKFVWNESANAAKVVTMADLAFNYWSKDLRPDLENTVPAYFPDKSTNIFGIPLAAGQQTRDNAEIYWNPKNDPASWQHLVQYMIGFGASGTLPLNDATYDKLRRGTLGWPEIDTGVDDGRKIDDMWHAALNSRGSFFTASDPAALAKAISDIIASIIARRGASTALSVALPILTTSSEGYVAGYDTSDWSGYLKKYRLAPNGTTIEPPLWEAGALLNARAPTSRRLFTWDSSSARKGITFQWGSLNSAQQTALNKNPDTSTADGNGQLRVDYLRGTRSNETTAPIMRRRSTVLGSVINSQPVYVSGAVGGFQDSFLGQPGYDDYVRSVAQRVPTVYVGANDGMLHAFDAVTGAERFAYIPDIFFANGKLAEYTNPKTGQLIASVDDQPVVQDVYLNGAWRTVLVGTYRLGGRGVYALDITSPDSFGANNVLWEYTSNSLKLPTSSADSPIGYTYDSANIMRLNSGKWVVILSTGYFPTSNPDVRGLPDPATTDSNNSKTSLLVIDLETGALIRKIDTSSAPQAAGVVTFGLSGAIAYDLNSDQSDDVAVAGDLAGNLWRFDLSDVNSANWKVDLIFKDYTSAPTAANPPVQPISVLPVGMRFGSGRKTKPIWVFGTGKYLGKEDRTSTGIPSNVGPQAFYGIVDQGTNSANYPIQVSQLVAQKITQDTSGNRKVTGNALTSSSRGWKIPLDTQEKGERAVITATPLYSTNRIILSTLIPQGEDPCKPSRRGGFLVVDAGSGGPAIPKSTPDGPDGWVISDPLIPISGRLPIVTDPTQDSSITIPICADGDPTCIPPKIGDIPQHRGSWRELLDIL